jgi:hypothetical protein
MGKEVVMGTTGKIESPNYPAAYPNSYDYRWNIITSPGTKIQLLFAFFKTQEMFDFVLVRELRFFLKILNLKNLRLSRHIICVGVRRVYSEFTAASREIRI